MAWLLTLLLLAPDDPATLVQNLGADDFRVRNAAYRKLLQQKDERVIPLLARALPRYPSIAQTYGMRVLMTFAPKKSGPALRRLLTSESPYLRAMAAHFLGKQEELAKALEDGRATTADRTRILNDIHGVRSGPALRAILGFLAPGEEPALAGAALYHFYRLRQKTAMPACRTLLQSETRAGVRAMAAAYLYSLGDESAAGTLAEAIHQGVGATEFYRVYSFLGTRPAVDDAILEAITESLEEDHPYSYMTQAIGLLAKFRYHPAVPGLKKALDHRNAKIAKAAFDALAGLGGALEKESMRKLLRSDDADRRIWAADALRRMDDLSGLPQLVTLVVGGTDTQRADAAKALGGFRVAASVEPLLAALEDRYATARSYARSSLVQVLRTLFPYRRLDVYNARPAEIRAWWEANRKAGW